MVLITLRVFAWEINTHRAIERKAVESSQNLQTFLTKSGLENYYFDSSAIQFDGYNTTYINYLINSEENGISDDKWKQEFRSLINAKPKELIEAGAILEDAQWPHSPYTPDVADRADGRFVNHFYDAQNGGKGLVAYNILEFQNVLKWGTVGIGSKPTYLVPQTEIPYISAVNAMLSGISHRIFSANNNDYGYGMALEYFRKGFTEANPNERRKYQAKMFVALGHVMHLMNDMTSPAHTRDDNHPEGDVMEVWGRGGEDGKQNIGYKIVGNSLDDDAGIIENQATNMPKYDNFSDFITKEATWTATHFFSKDTIFTKPRPSRGDTYESIDSVKDGVTNYYIKSDGTGYAGCRDGCVPVGTKLAIGIKSWLINKLQLYYPDRAVGKTTTFRGDYSVLKENARILIPRAIANARNFLNYFFRGQIEAKIYGKNITIKNISDPSLVKDRSTVIIKPGNFYIKYTTKNDDTLRPYVIKLDEEHMFDFNIEKVDNSLFRIGGFASLVTLAPGESLVVPIVRDPTITSKNIIVVYDGTIGNKRGLAVCKAQTPNVIRE